MEGRDGRKEWKEGMGGRNANEGTQMKEGMEGRDEPLPVPSRVHRIA